MSFNIAHEPLPLRELLVAERGGRCGVGQSTGFWAHACMHTCAQVRVCMQCVYVCTRHTHVTECVCMYSLIRVCDVRMHVM